MKTQIMDGHSKAAVEAAAAAVEAGGLVAFATETVYGIACRVQAAALSRLDRIKGRPAGKQYTLHIAGSDQLGKYVPRVGLRTKSLVRRAWPGPLTLVFRLGQGDVSLVVRRLGQEVAGLLYANQSVGVRCPDHPVATALLRACDFPVVAPSANRAGEAPATDAQGALERFGGQVDLVLDGGQCRYKRDSTVAAVDVMGVQVLRPGVLSEEELAEMATVRFMFVCTGNTCRSAMAEGIFRQRLAEKLGVPVDRVEGSGYRIVSAGMIQTAGYEASDEAVAACASRGIDISSHRSRALTRDMIEASDVVYCMTRAHLEHVRALCPEAEGKSMLLAEDEDIADPIGQSQECFDGCASVIDESVKRRVSELVL